MKTMRLIASRLMFIILFPFVVAIAILWAKSEQGS